ncbi:polysaccharide biosynthesis/export family protein, partial [Luteitalea sp.]|uniref:polysaccharide biosynthesis/export family protein n=1 Tax=Luteitalea sp. TaxID=2004800 RepID=UPI0025BC1E9A
MRTSERARLCLITVSGARRARRCGLALSLIGLTWLCAPAVARADYRLQIGDVVEIWVAGVPELQRRVAIKVDGHISFPLLGNLAVAGLSPSQLQAAVQAALATKVFQHRMPDGRDITIPLAMDAVTASVVEYRPIYVDGDVSKAGEFPYRPLMTVRQALALAGGLDPLRVRLNNPYFESADLRADHAASWVEFAKEQARVARIKVELGHAQSLDARALMQAPVPQSILTEIVQVETEQLTVRLSDHERQKAFLRRAIQQGDEQIRVLTEQQQKEEQGTRADAEELQKVLELYGKGSLPSPRVTDARRAVLLSATRKLQTASQLMQVTQQQEELVRQMEKLDDLRKIDLLKELQDTLVRVAVLGAKLQGIGEKLRYTSVRSQRLRGSDLKSEIVVVRKNAERPQRVSVDEDYVLEPGDVVEVTLRIETGSAGDAASG